MIHKEGYRILIILFLLMVCLNLAVSVWLPMVSIWVLLASVVFYLFLVSFFRNPNRSILQVNDNLIYAPADGKIVVIERTHEKEYFGDERIQVSIFMSPANVHVNRNPISGQVNYFKYHPGKYLVAWHPKSSEENERTTTVIENGGTEILLRQIAGAVARRIVNYLKVGQNVIQGADMGFIKFGSRVDLFLPLDSKVLVSIDDKVKGNKTVIAELKQKV